MPVSHAALFRHFSKARRSLSDVGGSRVLEDVGVGSRDDEAAKEAVALEEEAKFSDIARREMAGIDVEHRRAKTMISGASYSL